MVLLLPLLLTAAIYVAVRLVLSPPTWLRALATAAAPEPRDQGTATVEVVEWDVFALPLVRRRLSAIADELERLEHDPSVFARGFHTRAAESAYRALLAEEARLTEDQDARLRLGHEADLAIEFTGGPGHSIEVLDL